MIGIGFIVIDIANFISLCFPSFFLFLDLQFRMFRPIIFLFMIVIIAEIVMEILFVIFKSAFLPC